jgi:ABC-type branched-subunit amino acid transport system permease subunit
VLLTFVPEGLRMLSNVSPKLEWIGESRMLFYSLLLIILMIVRPQGLFTWPMWKRKSA